MNGRVVHLACFPGGEFSCNPLTITVAPVPSRFLDISMIGQLADRTGPSDLGQLACFADSSPLWTTVGVHTLLLHVFIVKSFYALASHYSHFLGENNPQYAKILSTSYGTRW